ncbi:MAG: hypothetical protein ACN6OP_24665 [Pseudomonadales bacterium]
MTIPIHAPSLLRALEGSLIGMPANTEEEIEVTRLVAASFLAEKPLWQRIGESDRASAFLRILRTLVRDPRGPGYEMLNEYAQLRKQTHNVDGDCWRNFWTASYAAPFPAETRISKLSDLSYDLIVELRYAYGKGKGEDWISQLLGRDDMSQETKDFAIDRMTFLRSLTDEDFVLPIEAYYGLIRTPSDNAAMLNSFGVEVGQYDDNQSAYHVRVNAAAYRNLQPYAVDFPLDALQRWDENQIPFFEGHPEESFLLAAKAVLTYRIQRRRFDLYVNSLDHDGRGPEPGEDTSGAISCWLDELERIDEELIDQAANASLQRHVEGRPDPAPAP